MARERRLMKSAARADTEGAADGARRPVRRAGVGAAASIVSLIGLVILGIVFVPVALSVWVLDLLRRPD